MSVIFKIIVSVLKRPEGESVLTTIIDVSKITTTFSVECKKEVKNTKPKDELVYIIVSEVKVFLKQMNETTALIFVNFVLENTQ